MDVESLLFSAPWLCVGIWCAVYAADHYMTIAGARLYTHGAKDHVFYEGSYELNPAFEADVNALRLFGPRFVALLLLGSLVIAAFWYWAVQTPETRNLFLFGYGALTFPELALVTRHAGNIALFRRFQAHQGVDGQIKYARWLSIEASSISLYTEAALLFAAALVTWKATLFGGVFGLLLNGLRQAMMSRRLRVKAQRSADLAPTG